MRKPEHKPFNTLRLLKIQLLVLAIAIAVFLIAGLIPRQLSSDPCLTDWDIKCTYAPEYVQKLDSIGFGVGILMAATVYAVVATLILTLIVFCIQKVSKVAKGKKK